MAWAKVSGSKLYADLRAGGVDHEAAPLLVEAFARKECASPSRGRRVVPDDPVQHDVDMEAYDAALIESGLFEFVHDLDEDETTLTFLAEPEAPSEP